MERLPVDVSGSIKHESATPQKVEVTRGLKGSYGWTISIAGSSMEAILMHIKQTDDKLKDMFPSSEGV